MLFNLRVTLMQLVINLLGFPHVFCDDMTNPTYYFKLNEPLRQRINSKCEFNFNFKNLSFISRSSLSEPTITPGKEIDQMYATKRTAHRTSNEHKKQRWLLRWIRVVFPSRNLPDQYQCRRLCRTQSTRTLSSPMYLALTRDHCL